MDYTEIFQALRAIGYIGIIALTLLSFLVIPGHRYVFIAFCVWIGSILLSVMAVQLESPLAPLIRDALLTLGIYVYLFAICARFIEHLYKENDERSDVSGTGSQDDRYGTSSECETGLDRPEADSDATADGTVEAHGSEHHQSRPGFPVGSGSVWEFDRPGEE